MIALLCTSRILRNSDNNMNQIHFALKSIFSVEVFFCIFAYHREEIMFFFTIINISSTLQRMWNYSCATTSYTPYNILFEFQRCSMNDIFQQFYIQFKLRVVKKNYASWHSWENHSGNLFKLNFNGKKKKWVLNELI